MFCIFTSQRKCVGWRNRWHFGALCLLLLLQTSLPENQSLPYDEVHNQVQNSSDVWESGHQMKQKLWNVVRCDVSPHTKYGHRPPLDEERHDKQRHVPGSREVGRHKLGTVAKMKAFGLFVNPYPGEDIQYDVHHEDESEGHCGEEKVGDRSLHTVKVATATQTTGLWLCSILIETLQWKLSVR